MRVTTEQRSQAETRIRAAMDRLLRGDLPPRAKCDIKTLAIEAGVSRPALYSTYQHLKEEFEQRRERLLAAGAVLDPRNEQIQRLKETIGKLQDRLATQEQAIGDLTRFKSTALSRLAAQHDEIQRLRHQIASHGNIRALNRLPSQTRDEAPRSGESTGPQIGGYR